jgi:DNA invertase Pin-like site-specific DNA recombinase
MGNLMLSVMEAFAEFERPLIGERLRGVYRGRKYALSDEQVAVLRSR